MFRHQFITNSSINLVPLIHDANIGLFEVIRNDLDRGQIQSLFIESCCKGALLIAKELFESNFDIDVHENHEDAFRGACYGGHLEVAKWSWQLGQDIDIHAENEYAFESTCRNGDLEAAKWLWQLDKSIDIHALESAFIDACSGGHLEVAQWLLQFGQNVAGATSLRSAHDVRTSGISFYKSIGMGERSELSVSEVALATRLDQNINLHADDEYAFRLACHYGHI